MKVIEVFFLFSLFAASLALASNSNELTYPHPIHLSPGVGSDHSVKRGPSSHQETAQQNSADDQDCLSYDADDYTKPSYAHFELGNEERGEFKMKYESNGDPFEFQPGSNSSNSLSGRTNPLSGYAADTNCEFRTNDNSILSRNKKLLLTENRILVFNEFQYKSSKDYPPVNNYFVEFDAGMIDGKKIILVCEFEDKENRGPKRNSSMRDVLSVFNLDSWLNFTYCGHEERHVEVEESWENSDTSSI